MHRILALPAAGLILLSSIMPAQAPPKMPSPAPQWKLVWHDEFDGPEGSLPEPSRWSFETGGDGWGNHELETYTARAENASLHNGNLVLTARRENFTGEIRPRR